MKEPKDYIVFPLDMPSYAEAEKYTRLLRGKVGMFKIGLELFIAEGPWIIRKIMDTGDADVFLDLKLHDIPATMQRAFHSAARHGPKYITVHCDKGEAFLKKAADTHPEGTKILGITLLTSLGPRDLARLGYTPEKANDPAKLVLLRALIAREAGCHGIVCSGREVAMVKDEMGSDFIAVTPGIRPAWSLVAGEDQKRIVTPADAVRGGADHIVIGRPIRDATDPLEAVEAIQDEIASLF